MTSGEIEFLEPDPEPEPERPGPRRRIGADALAVAGWAAAAALAAVAPFQPFVGGPPALPRRYADYLPGLGTVDAWGDARFGIALEICAALFAILALATLVRALRGGSGPARTLLNGAAIGVPCLLAGVTITLGLYVAASPPLPSGDVGWTAYAPLHGTEAYGSTLGLSFTGATHAWCLWLAVAGLACGAVAAVAQHAANRTGRDLAG